MVVTLSVRWLETWALAGSIRSRRPPRRSWTSSLRCIQARSTWAPQQAQQARQPLAAAATAAAARRARLESLQAQVQRLHAPAAAAEAAAAAARRARLESLQAQVQRLHATAAAAEAAAEREARKGKAVAELERGRAATTAAFPSRTGCDMCATHSGSERAQHTLMTSPTRCAPPRPDCHVPVPPPDGCLNIDCAIALEATCYCV
jgi:hypothetical protein